MLSIFTSTILFLLLLAGLGRLLGKLFGFGSINNPWLYTWLGFFAVSTIAMLTSLFSPINNSTLAAFIVFGGLGIPSWYREYERSLSHGSKSEQEFFKYSAFLFLFCLACILSYVTWPGRAYDTDLYHAQVIRWLNEYGTPPGLGNLHARLAFNSSWHILAAIIDNGPWNARSEWITPSIALTGGFYYFLHELSFARQIKIRVYSFCILAWIAFSAVLTAPHLNYDEPAKILNAIVMLETYHLISLPKKNTGSLSIPLMLSVSSFMIKPITALSVIFCGGLTIYFLLNQKNSVYVWARIFLPSILACGVWVSRNIALSGYALFPLPLLGLKLDWAMTLQHVKHNYEAILAWARMPGARYMESLNNGFSFWFKYWLINNLHSLRFWIYAVTFPLFAVFLWLKTLINCLTWEKVFFFTWSLSGIIYWFASAPDFRFGDGFFVNFLALSVLFFFSSDCKFNMLRLSANSKIRMYFFGAWISIILFSVGLNMLLPSHNLLYIGTMSSRPVREHVIENYPRFIVWIPANLEDDRCGNAPLPSSPYYPEILDNLAMRERGNLGKGFRPKIR